MKWQHDWIAAISYSNNDNDKNCIWSFIREWYSPTCEDYTVQRRKFYLLLKWFITNTLNENHNVKYTKAMGLGLYAITSYFLLLLLKKITAKKFQKNLISRLNHFARGEIFLSTIN